MTENGWTRWPSREALSPKDVSRPRRLLAWAVRVLVLTVLMWAAFHDSRVHGWTMVAGAGGVLVAGGLAWALFRTTLDHRLWPSLGLVVMLLGLAAGAEAAGLRSPAVVLCCGCAITALERLPLTAAVPVASVAFAVFAVVDDGNGLTSASVIGGMALAGYALRLDAEARGNAQRLLAQERRRAPPKPSPPLSPNGPGSPGRSTTSWRTASRRSSYISRRRGC